MIRRRVVEHPVGVRFPSRPASLGRLPSCLAGGAVAGCPIQSGTPAAEGCQAHTGKSAWSGPSADHGSSAGCLGCWTTRRMSMHHHTQPDPLATESFPTDPSGLPEAGQPELLELADGDTLELRVGPVAKRLGDATVRMLGYNGSIPGPTLKVQQGWRSSSRSPTRGIWRRPCTGMGCGWRTAMTGCPMRPRRPSRWGGVHLPDPVPRRRPVLVPPPHPRGLHPGARPVRQHPGRPGRARLLAAGRPGLHPHRR